MTPTDAQIDPVKVAREALAAHYEQRGFATFPVLIMSEYPPSSLKGELDAAIIGARAMQAAMAGGAVGALPFDRDQLGRFVREAWVRWAETQPNPKASWLVPYDDLSEPDKEADRQIGEAVAMWTMVGLDARDSMQAADAQGRVRISALMADIKRKDDALRRADQFITNGTEFGFIRMPDASTPDPAHETPGIIRAALEPATPQEDVIPSGAGLNLEDDDRFSALTADTPARLPDGFVGEAASPLLRPTPSPEPGQYEGLVERLREKPCHPGVKHSRRFKLELESAAAITTLQQQFAAKDARIERFAAEVGRLTTIHRKDRQMIDANRRRAEAAEAKVTFWREASEHEASARAAAEAERDALREVLAPFARLEVPKRPQGNAGLYSILHKDVMAAAALSGAKNAEGE